jgi:hypothetical protein
LLKRIAAWRGKLLSYAARLVLIKACLASIPIYLLSFIKFAKWAIRILHTHMANCLWNDNPEAHNYHLVNWDTCNMLKEFGGLGVPNLRDLNICLLASWIKRYNVPPPFGEECNYVLRASKSSSHLTKFLVNTIHIYGSKIIYYKNTFHN